MPRSRQVVVVNLVLGRDLTKVSRARQRQRAAAAAAAAATTTATADAADAAGAAAAAAGRGQVDPVTGMHQRVDSERVAGLPQWAFSQYVVRSHDRKCPSSRQPTQPPAAIAAHPLAQSCPQGPKGAAPPRECRREIAL